METFLCAFAVNRQVHKIGRDKDFTQGVKVGKYIVAQPSGEGGIIDIVESSPFEEVESEHSLGFLHSAYSHLQRKAA
jgi:hypothetical protein